VYSHHDITDYTQHGKRIVSTSADRSVNFAAENATEKEF
jgi:hypothetical protein